MPKPKEIVVELYSYDNLNTLTFDSNYILEVEDSYQMNYKTLTITPKNKNDFIENNLKMHSKYQNNQSNNFYLYKNDGYNYVVKNNGSNFVVYSLASNIDGIDIPFPIIAGLTTNFYGWEYLDNLLGSPNVCNYNNYNDLKNFYSGLNSYLVSFDDKNQTITLRGYDKYLNGNSINNSYTTDWFCQIICTDEGFSIYLKTKQLMLKNTDKQSNFAVEINLSHIDSAKTFLTT